MAQRNRVHTDAAPKAVGPYSQAITVGDFVYTAGQMGVDPATMEFPSDDVQEQTRRVLRQPIASAPLAELAKGCRSVAIITSDATRPVPNHVLLPLVLGELREGGIDDADISIVVGTGVHRSLTPTELRDLVGDGIYARVKVVNHDARAREPASAHRCPGAHPRPGRLQRLQWRRLQDVRTGVVVSSQWSVFSGC